MSWGLYSLIKTSMSCKITLSKIVCVSLVNLSSGPVYRARIGESRNATRRRISTSPTLGKSTSGPHSYFIYKSWMVNGPTSKDFGGGKKPKWHYSYSVQFSRLIMSDSLWLHELQHTRPPCPSLTPRVYSNSCPSSQWCHPAISSSVVPFSSCPQSLPASGSFPVSHLFTWGGQNMGVSASASVLPMNTQDWSPLGWTGWISLQSKGLSRVFSISTVQKHQFFSAQLSL